MQQFIHAFILNFLNFVFLQKKVIFSKCQHLLLLCSLDDIYKQIALISASIPVCNAHCLHLNQQTKEVPPYFFSLLVNLEIKYFATSISYQL